MYFRYRNLSVVQGVLGGLRPAVVSMIASAGLSIMVMAFWDSGNISLDPSMVDWIGVLLFVGALVGLRKWKLNPIYVMIGAGVLGLVLYYLTGVRYAG